MTDHCRRVRESLAAGETTEGHLEHCPECAGFARDLERLREAAAGLPRPPFPAGPRRGAQPSSSGGRRALVALATAASIALAVGLVLRDHGHTLPPTRSLDARAPAAVEERLDLLTTLAEARRVYAPSTSGAQGWLALPTEETRAIDIDPLASLRAAALLIEDESTTSRRKK